MAKYSEAQRRAKDKWDKAHLETLGLRLPIGTKDVWRQYAERADLPSVTRLIQAAVEEKAERDGLK